MSPRDMFTRALFRLRRQSRRRSSARPQRRAFGAIDALEERRMLANIVWTNEGNDGFEVYNNLPAASNSATNAQVARAIVNEAIAHWERLIVDFGSIRRYVPGGGKGGGHYVNEHLDEFRVTISAQDLADPRLGQAAPTAIDVYGKPFMANVLLDVNAAGKGWFFDVTPWDHSEFAPAGMFHGKMSSTNVDFLSVVLHELGHGLGFYEYLTPLGGFLTPLGETEDLHGEAHERYQFNGPTATATFAGMGHLSPTEHPNDLMSPGIAPGTRLLVSDLDARIFNDVYSWGFQMALPSQVVGANFATQFNAQTGQLTLRGDVGGLYGDANDVIFVVRNGSNLRFAVNSYVFELPAAEVKSIAIQGGEGDDLVYVHFSQGNPLPQQGLTFDGQKGWDKLFALGSSAADYFTLLGQQFQVGSRTATVANTEELHFYGQGDNDFFLVHAVAPGMLTYILGGQGDDSVWVSGAQATLDGMAGFLAINGEGGANSVIAVDTGSQAGRAFALDENTLSRDGFGVFHFQNIAMLEVYAGSGADTLELQVAPTTKVNFYGGLGSDGLIGGDQFNTWQITGSNSGQLNGKVFFQSVENLYGGTLVDRFYLGGLASLAGAIVGGGHPAGTLDSLHYGNYGAAATVNLASHTATGIGSFSGIGGFFGSMFQDVLVGANADAAWLIGPGLIDAGQVTYAAAGGSTGKTYRFSSFENLFGGTHDDVFSFGQGASSSGGVRGGAGLNDTLDYSAWTSGLVLDLATLSGFERVVGGSGNDTLIGSGSMGQNHWLVRGLNQGAFNRGGLSIDFSDFENLKGSDANDTFHFLDGGALSGWVSGGAGHDLLDYSARAAAVTVDLHLRTATGLASFHQLEAVEGSQSLADTLIGPSAAGTTFWNLTGTNSGNVNGPGGYGFASFENLVGGSGFDTFVFGNLGQVSGSIQGGGGIDTLDYQARQAGVEVYLFAHLASGVGGAVHGIENVIGTELDDVLAGNDADNHLEGRAGNDLLLGLGGADNLAGGAGHDLLIGGAGADKISGGDGDDLLIGGSTAYDANFAALADLHQRWTQPASYAERVALLSTPQGNGSPVLDISTVYDDEAVDILLGQGHRDWFWATKSGSYADLVDAALAEHVSEPALAGTA